MRWPTLPPAALAVAALTAAAAAEGPRPWSAPLVRDPVAVYVNWAAYDELSDDVELDEALAMRQLDEMIRLRRLGVRLDYYLMDCFWFSRDGGYLGWRTPHWPNGPDAWLRRARENGIKPGLWLGTNAHWGKNPLPLPEWEDSYDPSTSASCLFRGGFLAGFVNAMQHWYDRGVRAFKLDFANLDAAPPDVRRTHSAEEIRALNAAALRGALAAFRERNPEVLFLAYNGFGGTNEGTWQPFFKDVDTRWLEAFDSLYCGDPRLADVPSVGFWRAKDVYSDHMVRRYEANRIPLERIDSSAFMIGTTGTCYGRRTAAWKGMLVLSLARGGFVNTYYGNLDLLDDAKAAWFARAQALFLPLQAAGRTRTFGGVPGEGEPYGYAALSPSGALYTVVNPSQAVRRVPLPLVSREQEPLGAGRVLFRDAGFSPRLEAGALALGPEQMAVVGFGAYAGEALDLGLQEDVVVPESIERLDVVFSATEGNAASATFDPPAGHDLRVLVRQRDERGEAVRSSGGAPPRGRTLGTILVLGARQAGREVPVRIAYDKAIWSGLSWAAGEIRAADLRPGQPLVLTARSTETRPVILAGEVHAVRYGAGR